MMYTLPAALALLVATAPALAATPANDKKAEAPANDKRAEAPAKAVGKSRHAIGVDLVRLLDNAQFEPNDGTLNLFYQGYLTANTAWVAGYADGERSRTPELSYKVYNQGYQAGSFWQLGVAVVDVDGTTYTNDPAIWGAFGFERAPAPNLVISVAAKAMVGIDHPHTGENDIIFLPSLSALFTF